MNVEIVIPSIKEEVRTLDSVPDEVPVRVVREGSLNEARNLGVERAGTDRIIIMDDDIAFERHVLRTLTDTICPGRLVGIRDWDFGLVAGRVMAFHRSDWRRLGGFDERLGSHMGDTDFALRFARAVGEVYDLPRDLFDHEDHERSITTWDRAWRLAYLVAKQPRNGPRLLAGVY